MLIVFVGLYLLIQLLISILVSKRIKTEKDFFLAGRSLPLWLLSFSLFVTWFGAETTIGTSGAVFKDGLSGSRADPFGYSICLFALGALLATKLWKGGFVTLADFFRSRFGSQVEKLGILIIVPSSLLWGAAQMRAFGQVITSMTDWPLDGTLWIAFLFVTVYTLLGGLLGDIITDMIQGLMIAIGLSLTLYFILASDFSFSSWLENVSPERLSFRGAQESLWERIDRWSIPIFG
ncbi:MAG: sodium:solute symporter, partial [Pseudomonadota bacterium]